MSEPYGEDSISVLSNRDAVLKRPGMFFGDLASGDAYACIIHEIAEAALSWQIGANIRLDLLPGNEVELSCYAHLPENQRPHEQHGSRPIQVLTPQLTWTGFGQRLTRGAEYAAVACQHMVWEIRDRFGEGCASFNEGHCTAACGSATELPIDLCLRVTFTVGSPDISIAPATIDQVAKRVRYMSGPAEAGHWGCIGIFDQRTHEMRSVVVTDYPERLGQ